MAISFLLPVLLLLSRPVYGANSDKRQAQEDILNADACRSSSAPSFYPTSVNGLWDGYYVHPNFLTETEFPSTFTLELSVPDTSSSSAVGIFTLPSSSSPATPLAPTLPSISTPTARFCPVRFLDAFEANLRSFVSQEKKRKAPVDSVGSVDAVVVKEQKDSEAIDDGVESDEESKSHSSNESWRPSKRKAAKASSKPKPKQIAIKTEPSSSSHEGRISLRADPLPRIKASQLKQEASCSPTADADDGDADGNYRVPFKYLVTCCNIKYKYVSCAIKHVRACKCDRKLKATSNANEKTKLFIKLIDYLNHAEQFPLLCRFCPYRSNNGGNMSTHLRSYHSAHI